MGTPPFCPLSMIIPIRYLYHLQMANMNVCYVLALVLVACMTESALGKSALGKALNNVKRFGGNFYDGDLPTSGEQEDIAEFLLDNIHCDATVMACTGACTAGAATYLGPFAGAAAFVCPDACDRGLEQAEDQAHNPSDNFLDKAAASMQEYVEEKVDQATDPQKACVAVCTTTAKRYLGLYGACCAQQLCEDEVCPRVIENINNAGK